MSAPEFSDRADQSSSSDLLSELAACRASRRTAEQEREHWRREHSDQLALSKYYMDSFARDRDRADAAEQARDLLKRSLEIAVQAVDELHAEKAAADAALGALRARLHQTVTKMRAYNDSHAFLVHQWADELERANEP
jgi:protein required for attachment to host cells